MATRIATLLGVKPDEAKPIFILFIASFFLGGALLFFYTSSNAIFLSEFEAASLPYVYIVNSVFVILFGYIYAQLEKRTSLSGLLTSSLTILTVTIFVFWLALQASHNRTIIFVMMTWFRLLFIYTTLGLWELASAVFDVRQAKRLFALVSLGLLLAFIIGGLSTSLITQFTATENLLLLSAIFLLVYALILFRLSPSLGVDDHTEEEVSQTPPFTVREMFKDNYISLIFGLKTITIVNYYIVEFIFYQQAAVRYSTEENLANFFGLFIGLSTLGMALLAALATGRYITRFGMQVALLTMPTVLLITAFLSGSYGLLLGVSNTIFFLLAISIKFSNEVLEKSLHIPALGVLYQPIPRFKRMPVRVAVEGWWGSVALIVSGVLLLFFNQLPNVGVLFFIGLSVVTTVIYLGVTGWVYRHYQFQLKKAVSTRFLTGITLPNQTPDESFIQNELHSDHPAKVLAALQYSTQLAEHPEQPFLLSLLDHSSPDVQIDVLRRIAKMQYKPSIPKIQQMLDDNTLNRAVWGQALTTIMALEGLDASDMMSYLNTIFDEYTVSTFLDYGDEVGHSMAVSQIDDWAHSQHEDKRLLAAQFMGRVPEQTDNLIRLLHDSAHAVKHQAVRSAAPHLNAQIVTILLDMLQQDQFKTSIRHTLSQGGSAVATQLIDVFPTVPHKYQPDIIDICAAIGTKNTRDFLHAFLAQEAHDLNYDAAIAGLVKSEYAYEDIHVLLDRETECARHILVVSQSAPADILARAVHFDFHRLQQRIYNILKATYAPDVIRLIEQTLNHGQAEQRANALELLEVTVAQPIKQKIIPILEDTDLRARAEVFGIQAVANPLTYIQDNPQPFSAWTQLCVAYLSNESQELGDSMYSLIEKVVILRSVSIFAQTPDPILAEIASVLNEKQANAGDILIKKDTTDNRLFIIVDGRVHVHDDKSIDQYLGAREIVGELAVLDPAPRSATVTVTEPTTYFVLDADVLHDLMANHPEINQGVIRVLVQRIRRLDATAAQIVKG